MNKSTKLTDSLDGDKIVKKYLKAIKDDELKKAALLAKLFPYLLTKPKWEKEPDPEEVEQLVIRLHCQYLDNCAYCREEDRKTNEKRDEERRQEAERLKNSYAS
jgi:hypothetical protein